MRGTSWRDCARFLHRPIFSSGLVLLKLFQIGDFGTSATPTSNGEAVVFYSVNSALSAGLNLNTSNGIIRGTPTAIWQQAQRMDEV